MKNVEDEELPHKLFVTTIQSIKICTAIANNISSYIKSSRD